MVDYAPMRDGPTRQNIVGSIELKMKSQSLHAVISSLKDH